MYEKLNSKKLFKNLEESISKSIKDYEDSEKDNIEFIIIDPLINQMELLIFVDDKDRHCYEILIKYCVDEHYKSFYITSKAVFINTKVTKNNTKKILKVISEFKKKYKYSAPKYKQN